MSGSVGWDRTASTLEAHVGALSLLSSDDFTAEFWRPFWADETQRGAVLSRAINVFESALESGSDRFVEAHLATIVRYATEVPYRDVTDAFRALSTKLQEAGFSLPESCRRPATFIPKKFFEPVDTDNPVLHELFAAIFYMRGRVTHLNRVQCLHPAYFDHYWPAYVFAMKDGSSPLAVPSRSYVGILVAASLNCPVLIDVHQEEFLLQGGLPRWLHGIESAPAKLRNLLPVVHVLCHRPWRLDKETIAPLLQPGEDSWSLAELLHAIVIIATVKSLCGMVFGCGVAAEIDLDARWRAEVLGGARESLLSDADERDEDDDENTLDDEDEDNDIAEDLEVSTQRIRELLHAGGWTPDSNDADKPLGGSKTPADDASSVRSSSGVGGGRSAGGSGQTSPRSQGSSSDSGGAAGGLHSDSFRFFEKADSSSQGFEPEALDPFDDANVSRYIGPDPPVQYEDFDIKSKEYSVLRVQDYSWNSHGFDLCQQLLPDCAAYLDALFTATYDLTYNAFAGTTSSVDTAPFRRAIWQYVQRIKGIFHDDYNYQDVNEFLPKQLKSYIKKITCAPETITKADYKDMQVALRHDEKVHVALLAVESSKQCELLYGLHAIQNFKQ